MRLTALICLVLILVACDEPTATGPEPTYKNKPLSHWRDLTRSDDIAQRLEGATAMIHAGKLSDADRSHAVSVLADVVRNGAVGQAVAACQALGHLGPAANEALPAMKELEAKMTNTDSGNADDPLSGRMSRMGLGEVQRAIAKVEGR